MIWRDMISRLTQKYLKRHPLVLNSRLLHVQ